ncbi:MAG: hypothetical protein FWE06_09750 [Oscillospiraceae bacterium]|nr:hypothetical protein [Oscillospiraceae bacterium]
MEKLRELSEFSVELSSFEQLPRSKPHVGRYHISVVSAKINEKESKSEQTKA